ncbi:M1 family aminopeptidase [Candidatus Neomarinimicrobiota bacterium]
MRSLLYTLMLMLITPGLSQDRGFSDEYSVWQGTRDRQYDVQHIVLDISFDQAEETVSGLVSTTLSPINDGLTTVVLDAADMSISSVNLVASIDVEKTAKTGMKPLAYDVTEDQLIIELDKSYDSDESLTIEITYHAKPGMGLYFVHPDEAYPDKPWQIWSQGEMEENHHWFPCYDFPNERMTSEMIATVPEGQMVISNGELLEVRPNRSEGTVTYHWRENVPHVSYLISVIVGEFLEVRDDWQGIPVSYFVEPKHRDLVERSFSKTPDMMDFYSKRIGIPYPYEKYAQTTIADFMWGGMENISATTLTDGTLHDERAHLDRTSDGLVAHELVHMWFGDLITTKNWNHIWLNEGFATYFEDLYVEYNKGVREFYMSLEQEREDYFEENSRKYSRPIVTNFYEDPDELFDRHSYQKGGLVLHMVRYILGDELWWKAIRHYAKTHSGETVETNDFKQAIEDATGIALDWFFDQWVYRAGHPVYEVSWEWERKRKVVDLNVKQVQADNGISPLFRMPVEIAVTGNFGTQRSSIEVSKSEESFLIDVSEKPIRVEFDPENHILKELRFTKSKKEVLDQLKNSIDAGRMRAAGWLAEYQDGKTVEALGYTLRHDPFRGVREKAAESLGEIKTKASRDSLLANLHTWPSSVRRGIITALGKYTADEKVAASLEEVFRTDSSYYAQADAIESLAEMGASKAYDLCVEALDVASYSEVIRRAALAGFASLNDSRGIDHALYWATYGRPSHSRSGAIKALSKLGGTSPDRKAEIRDFLVALLDDPSLKIRGGAMYALGELGDRKAIADLKASYDKESHFELRERARNAINLLEAK